MSLKVQENRQLEETENFVHDHFEGEGSGHDYWHIYRVRNLSVKFADLEGGNKFCIEMAALLHDLDDWKLSGDSSEKKAELWMKSIGVADPDRLLILEIIDQVSYKGAGVETKAITVEAKIVQDADRLDAIGAIGIARTFAYGGNKKRLIYHPDIKPEIHNSFEEYKKTTAPTINHFYEKLLLLKERINTKSAKKIAEQRHQFMKTFLEQFYGEWESEI